MPGSFAYERAQTIAAVLGDNGYSVITGGGPGVMEAANKGAGSGSYFRWVEYRAAAGTKAKHLRKQASELPVFFRTKSNVREILYRLCHFAGRIWDVG